MKRACRFRRTGLAAAVGSAVLSLAAGHAGLAYGSAFALQEQSGSGLGNAFAGGAAVAEDAATIFANPAGMSRLTGMQAVAAGSLICLEAKFRNNGNCYHRLQHGCSSHGRCRCLSWFGNTISGNRRNI